MWVYTDVCIGVFVCVSVHSCVCVWVCVCGLWVYAFGYVSVGMDMYVSVSVWVNQHPYHPLCMNRTYILSRHQTYQHTQDVRFSSIGSGTGRTCAREEVYGGLR